MQKALTEMNIQLANVISDISGTTGLAILCDIVQGERDPTNLSHNVSRCFAWIAMVVMALDHMR